MTETKQAQPEKSVEAPPPPKPLTPDDILKNAGRTKEEEEAVEKTLEDEKRDKPVPTAFNPAGEPQKDQQAAPDPDGAEHAKEALDKQKEFDAEAEAEKEANLKAATEPAPPKPAKEPEEKSEATPKEKPAATSKAKQAQESDEETAPPATHKK